MNRLVLAIIISLLVHVIVATLLVFCFDVSSAPSVPVQLELSSVKLSIVETVSDPSPPSPPVDAAPFPVNSTPPLVDAEVLRVPLPVNVPPFHVNSTPPPVDAEVLRVPPPAPRQAKIEAPARPQCNLRPDYPRGARQRGEQGEVELEFKVAADGSVSEVRVVASSGYRELDESALTAVRQAKFVPAQSEGHAIASTVRIALTFKLK